MGNPPATPSQSCHLLLKSSGWESTLSTWEMHRWALLTPCPPRSSPALAGRGCLRGCFIDGCAWLEICLPTPFDPPTHLLTPSPPPWSSAPSFPSSVALHPPTHQAWPMGNDPALRGVMGWGWFGHPGARKELQTPQSKPGEPIPSAEPSFKDVWAEQYMA